LEPDTKQTSDANAAEVLDASRAYWGEQFHVCEN
jgi:hypothetical protein